MVTHQWRECSAPPHTVALAAAECPALLSNSWQRLLYPLRLKCMVQTRWHLALGTLIEERGLAVQYLSSPTPQNVFIHSWGGVGVGLEPSEEGPVRPWHTKSIPSHHLVPSIGNQFEWTVQRRGEIWGHDAVDKASNLHHLDRNKSNRVWTPSITVLFTRGPIQHTWPMQVFSFTLISSLNSYSRGYVKNGGARKVNWFRCFLTAQ